MYRKFIEEAGRLTTLQMRCNRLIKGDTKFVSDSGWARISFFSFIESSKDGELQPIKLDHLTLQVQGTGRSEDKYPKCIDVLTLKQLEVIWSQKWPGLLTSIATKFAVHRPCLAYFTFDMEGFGDYCGVLESLVKSFQGLRLLRIETLFTEDDQILDHECLSGHAKTLHTLHLNLQKDILKDSTSVVSDDHTSGITARCESLEQLGIALPTVRFDNERIEDWNDFGAAIDQIMQLSRLRILTILTVPPMEQSFHTALPEDDDNEYSNPLRHHLFDLETKQYISQINGCATKLMKYMARDRPRHQYPSFVSATPISCVSWASIMRMMTTRATFPQRSFCQLRVSTYSAMFDPSPRRLRGIRLSTLSHAVIIFAESVRRTV